MSLGNPLRDAQPKAGTPLLPRSRLVDAIESLKDMGQIVRRNTDPGIGDLHLDPTILPTQ